jgi:membrane-bound inhibitor of C-type lysozyme
MTSLRKSFTPAILIAALAFAACSPNPDQIVKAEKTEPSQIDSMPLQPPSQWQCEDGRVLTVAFYGDRVDIQFPDASHRTLPVVIAASGEAYEADGLRFHAKGGVEAYIEEAGKVTNCTVSAHP